MKRDAFTMLELVFAIVIAGVLAALAIPRLERDFRQEAIDNVLSSIRYTQHLALMDNRHSRVIDEDWQKSFWTIRFDGNGDFFTISSNADLGGNVDENETARDPVTGKRFYSDDAVVDDNESINIFLNRKYGIDEVNFDDCEATQNGTNNSRHIAFDHMGRPHKGMYGVASNVYDTRMTADCNITFRFSDVNIAPFTVLIQEETGYAQIVGQEDL